MAFLKSRKGKKKDIPAYWKSYAERNRLSISPDTGIGDLNFTVIDTETTGLDPSVDRIITFAGIRVTNFSITIGQSLDVIVMNQDRTKDKSRHIHEITDLDKSRGIPEEMAIHQIIEFIGNSIITGINIGFDVRMLNKSAVKYGGGKLLNRTLELTKLVRRLENPVYENLAAGNFDLESLCSRYSIPQEGFHTAAGDAMATSMLFVKILHKLGNRGIVNWRELNRSLL